LFDTKKALWFIKSVADEQEYKVEENGETGLLVWLGKRHGVDFEISINASNYIQCNQWDEQEEEYGRAIYSIRSQSDVTHFCNILISSSLIRAKRRN